MLQPVAWLAPHWLPACSIQSLRTNAVTRLSNILNNLSANLKQSNLGAWQSAAHVAHPPPQVAEPLTKATHKDAELLFPMISHQVMGNI